MSEQRNSPTDPFVGMNNMVSLDRMFKTCQLGYPNGGILECRYCGKEKDLTLEQVVKLLTTSWPKLCSDCQKPADLKTI